MSSFQSTLIKMRARDAAEHLRCANAVWARWPSIAAPLLIHVPEYST